MSRYQCVDGHIGPAYVLGTKSGEVQSVEETVKRSACPTCGKDVALVPCNKHSKKVAHQKNNGGVPRKPFALGIVGVTK